MSERQEEVPKQSGQPVEGDDQTLVEAINAAGLLLDYAAERGADPEEKVIDEKVMETIVRSKHTLATRALSSDEEIEFWVAYRKLCIATSPVSSESLKATRVSPVGRSLFGKLTLRSEARKSVRYYQGITILALMVLLLFQVYWVFLSTLVRDTRDVNDSLLVFETNGYKKQLGMTPLMEEDIINNKDEKKSEQALPYRQHQSYDYKLDPQYTESYRKWRANLELLKKTDILGRLFNVEEISKRDPGAINQGETERQQFLNSVLTQTGTISVNVMSLYFLPILYGLVGACAYILRTISQQIEVRTFTRASNIQFHLRMVLGALAGFSVAWFVSYEGDQTVLKNVAPLALAFLAGYSIELVFSAMDTLVEAFSRKRAAK